MSAGESEWCKQYVKNGQISQERFEELCRGLATNQVLVLKLCEERGITRDLPHSDEEQTALQLSLATPLSSHSTSSSSTQSSSPEPSPTREHSPTITLTSGRPSMPRPEGAGVVGGTAENIVDISSLLQSEKREEAKAKFKTSASNDQAIAIGKAEVEDAKFLLESLSEFNQGRVLSQFFIISCQDSASESAGNVRSGQNRLKLNQILGELDNEDLAVYMWQKHNQLTESADGGYVKFFELVDRVFGDTVVLKK